ncbi:hypothetical protein ASPZODRAFT_169645 [Penicilliopsis zonata CBS 506.65]|uniref:Uncharacterized protein n=1 Tax=Penicilliopsis zonata CBS 506.65 TaxID=1073090 RepID=A0A1L9S7B3_9EURO|nr:hypothetical protein ASPZODRAFT_169645 [Penicilliopsis zonata CBS 506.65]OJJ43062.1 hypothetical protein ASPZODRAFT_169645 [Penicilliopsis zonata CBS 506.65]
MSKYRHQSGPRAPSKEQKDLEEVYRKIHSRKMYFELGIVEWDFFTPDIVGELTRLKYLIQFWAWNWFSEDLSSLSKTQKRSIIGALQHCCLLEDWDDLVGRFSSIHRHVTAVVFIEALLWTDIVNKIYDKPFWYFDGKMGPDDKEGDPQMVARLQHLYERYLESTCSIWFPKILTILMTTATANPLSASTWRSETIRLANSTDIHQARSQKFGEYHRQRRKDVLIPLMEDGHIATELISLLLKPLSQEKEKQARRQELIKVYQMAAEGSVKIHAARGHLKYNWLDSVDKTFAWESKTLKAHTLYPEDDDDLQLQGCPVLLITTPVISQAWVDGFFPQEGFSEIMKATAVVAENEGPGPDELEEPIDAMVKDELEDPDWRE